MRFFITILNIIAAAVAFSQITIGPEDMPTVNDTLRYSIAEPTDVDLTSTGPSTVWDFSGLLAMADEEDVLVSVSSTPLLYQFYFNNNLLYPEHVASYAMQGEPFSFQVITVENVYEYFRVNGTGFRNVGFGAMVNGLPTSVRRQPIDRIYQFPLAFGNVDSSFSAWNFSVPGTFYFEQEQWRHNTADGWGTLHLPTDTFQVLRVRSVLNRHDSVFVSQFGTGFAFDEPEVVEYKWLAPGMGRPVLNIVATGGMPVVIEFYRSDVLGTGITTTNANEGLMMFPNPASERLHFRSAVPVSGRLQVRDLQGRVVLTSQDIRGVTNWSIPVHALPIGNYTVELEGLAPWQGRFVVAH